ncbi:hypothetical protein EI42_00069 [Thermosporothrix hazakensis]|jgi:uncharacterized protein YyaL (SSP411 family)|uniref:Spermatogenesis-associated protein 20-like TRX domain-containing protein n=2 Tax=Thermosporothrix TaxID=768650 RepID=A0A326UCT7_THEHA|nr:DUF255 domain-containing protein [Thermosporothrix hazakensis]PZW35904.1 hypothetical protein EI42_00069 [Thermosporothrix hazakensis]BBH88371.1 thioredoxin domain-containing protein [Thermosporothrix sp. COM3]GCE46558.1 thioredoxin domain-containing protein [Thermosporothrix hazakensis]
MSGDVVASQSQSSAAEGLRFSPHPNQAHQIAWRLWGKEAFDEAERSGKPIFLSLSSSWCQWCHIMDETTLSEPSVIAILNHDYIPIRVDSDLRPDVNQRYNQNGWPSIVLLSAEGEILWGGVYVPPHQMLYYLGHIRRYYSEHRAEIAAQIQQLRAHRVSPPAPLPLRALLLEERSALLRLPEEASRVLLDLYDPEYGGFLLHPHLRFPHPEALELWLMLGRKQQPELLERVTYSLIQMRDGGLWDYEEGGFFRYSAAGDWSNPHTEKMLEENAAMLRLLALTARETGQQEWVDLIRQLLMYLNNTLWQTERGVFSGSQCADEEYYEPGLYSRASREAPGVDTTVYTSWNARMSSSLLLAAEVLHAPALEKMACRILDYLGTHVLHPAGCMYHYELDGQPGLPGQLTDQVWMTRALLDAYERRGEKRYLETAIALMHFACQELLDRSTGLFYDYPETPDLLGRLTVRQQPLAENALAAECLLRMAVYSKREHLRETALLVLAACLEKYRRTGIEGALYACIVQAAIENAWF